LTTVYLIT